MLTAQALPSDTETRAGSNGASRAWELSGLTPTPEEDWQSLRSFLNLGSADLEAMLATVEPLFRRGYELVVGNYDYLRSFPETAAILGWEQGFDEAHLAERRRFMTVWLARTLGLDFSTEFARYLFRAGQIHAAHGPRRIHVPERYVTGAISLVHAAFARFLSEEMPGAAVVPAALAGWNKVLALHLHMMMAGYHSALALDSGDFPVRLALFGQMRAALGRPEVTIHAADGSPAEAVLVKFFNYFPQARAPIFDTDWQEEEPPPGSGTPWSVIRQRYRVKEHPAWRVLLNGRDLRWIGGPGVTLQRGDQISIFSPGR
jgi:molybdopterin converting factor small subunit